MDDASRMRSVVQAYPQSAKQRFAAQLERYAHSVHLSPIKIRSQLQHIQLKTSTLLYTQNGEHIN